MAVSCLAGTIMVDATSPEAFFGVAICFVLKEMLDLYVMKMKMMKHQDHRGCT